MSWASQYTRSSPQFDAGAAIALPFMANEVTGMNAKMGVMTADMDSTLGRAGRMMPWGW